MCVCVCVQFQNQEMKKATDKAIKDKEAANRDADRQIQEMVATLGNYSKENQKNITNKENEIEELTKKLEKQDNIKKSEVCYVVNF